MEGCKNYLGTGFMAVFAVSGSVVFLAMQAHKHLLSNFMKKMEFEFKKSPAKKRVKRVTFAAVDHSRVLMPRNNFNDEESLEAMPKNWQVMYKGILQTRNLRGYY